MKYINGRKELIFLINESKKENRPLRHNEQGIFTTMNSLLESNLN